MPCRRISSNHRPRPQALIIRKWWLTWCLLTTILVAMGFSLVIATCLASAAGGSYVLFSMEDRAGDDYGGGSITYPLHEVFEPGLFDLRRVHVWHDDHNIYFDISFTRVTNPWNAPEGFFHQLIDIYIDAEPGGHTQPVAPGPGVQFSAEAGWEYRLRIQPWGDSQWLDGRSNPGKVHAIKVLALPDGKTIRAGVPLTMTGPPNRGWRYYVLVGGFDVFGPDHYRPIKETATQWSFGGEAWPGCPSVIDILDPGPQRRSQKVQLAIRDSSSDAMPVLLPVGPGLSLPFTWKHLLASLAVLCVLASIFLLLSRLSPPGHVG